MLNQFNQLGAYRRLRADRRLSMRADLSPFDRQRAELERDRDNLQWLMDSSEHLDRLLHDAMRILKGEDAGESSYRSRAKDVKKTDGPPRRFIACMPVDTDRTALGWSRALDDSFGESTVLDATLQRVSSSRELDGIALIIRRGAAVLQGIDLKKYAVPVTVIETDDDVFAGAPEAFGQARRWAPQSWRGSIGGTSIYDEYLVADAAMVALNETGGTHAVMVGPEWVFMNVTGDGGLDDLIARERASIAESNITFTQAPPGFGACLVSKRAMSQLTLKTRASTIGAALSYQPSSPTSDPIAFPINMQIEADVRHAMVRGTWDSRRQRERIGRVAQNPNELSTWPTPTLVTALDRDIDTHGDVFPSHLQLEITTRCSCRGRFHEHPFGAIDRPDIEPELARDLFAELAAYDDVVVTLGGVGDPLVHPSCARIVQYAKDAGISSVHLRTALRSDTDTIDAIVEAGADVLSVDLHAITPETYGVMMGTTDIDLVIRNLEYTVAQSRRFTTIPGSAGAALPWIVPRLQRCAETYNDLEAFYDRWKSVLGAAAIDPPPPFEPTSSYATDTLRPAITPADVAWRQLMTRFTVFADGSVPVSELDLAGNTVVGRAGTTPVTTLWSSLINARQEVRRTRGRDDVALRLFRP
ncbi:MAG: radical SAM protein [Planctomycetota bacterium]